MGDLRFRLPLTGNPRVNSPYGRRVDPFTKKKGAFHSGIDYAVKNATVYASESGRVVRAARHGALGELIIIDHTPNAKNGKKFLYTMYAHLSKYSVKLGDDVKRGEAIGLSGDSGDRVTGFHLHFAIIESTAKVKWNATGTTGLASTSPLFRDPERYYGVTTQANGLIDDITDEDRSKVEARLSYKHIIDIWRGTYRIDVSLDGKLIGHIDKNNRSIRTKVRIPS